MYIAIKTYKSSYLGWFIAKPKMPEGWLNIHIWTPIFVIWIVGRM